MGENRLPLDDVITITLSEDKLYAYLQVSKPSDEFYCTVDQLQELLKSHEIRFGILEDQLTQIANNPKNFFYIQVTIAIGIKPINGEDGYIRHLFDLDDHSKKPLELENGTVDYREINKINNVNKGQLICERISAAAGTHGKSVTGVTMLCKAGKEARFKIGKNVVADAEHKALYAAIDGIVTKTDQDKVNVFPIYEVNGDVDYNIGNIDFIGNVVIRGNVLSGFKVKAAGDIRITGGVEAADLEADGSIEVSAGILGFNKGIIKAGRNVKSSFVQEGIIEAGEDVIVSQSIMHSLIKAGRNVLCFGSKGLVVGGTLQAGEKVVARTVGNTMSTVTVLEVGVLPKLRNELIQLRSGVKLQLENLDKTEKVLALLDQLASAGQLNQDKVALKLKLGHTKKQTNDDLIVLKERILEIEKSLEDTDKARVEVINTIFAGTKVSIGRFTRFVKDSTQRVLFRMVDGEIVMMSLN